MQFRRLALAGPFMVLAVAMAAGDLSGQAIISNGTVQLGVDTRGQLNIPGPPSAGGVTTVGLRYLPTNNESTAPGCLCEGWGAGFITGLRGGVSGWVNNAYGSSNVSLVSFASTPTTATSVTTINALGGVPILEVTHHYQPSASPNLYEVLVTLRNLTSAELGTGSDGIRYARVMDWDIEPTPFNENVTIQGWPASNLRAVGLNGFATGDPFASPSAAPGCPLAVNTNVTDVGPCDHGSEWYFQFDALAAGASRSFKTFYGAAATEREMLAALGTVGAELYTLGQCSSADCENLGIPNTFAFAFQGVGGTPLPPPPPTGTVPEPMTVILLGSGLAGIAAARHRRREEDLD